MFYFPGSWYVGTALQWFLNLWLAFDFWWWDAHALDWDDNERRGAGSLVILFLLLAGAVVAGVLLFT